MIKTYRNKRLKRFYEKGDRTQFGRRYVERTKLVLDQLNAATRPEDMDLPGNDFHVLRGRPKRYTVHVNGNFCITFEWKSGNAIRVDFEDYH